jgi:hypothetical protein
MGLSNIQRELILKQQYINNCNIIITPISKPSEFNIIYNIHTKIISETINKNINVKSKKSKKTDDIILDKLDEQIDSEELIESVKRKNKDLLIPSEELSDDDLDLLDETTEISQDIDSKEIDSESDDLEEPVDDKLEEPVDDKLEDPVDDNKDNIEDSKKSTNNESKIVSEKTDNMPNIDEFFFTTLKEINDKKSKDSSHKSKDSSHKSNDKTREEEEIKGLKVKIESSSENNNDDKSGGSNIKTIKLTEKHDFF